MRETCGDEVREEGLVTESVKSSICCKLLILFRRMRTRIGSYLIFGAPRAAIWVLRLYQGQESYLAEEPGEESCMM